MSVKVAGVVALALVLAAGAAVASTRKTQGAAAIMFAGQAARPGLHVVGNHLIDARGRVVHLRGVNRSGTEYSCIQGNGIFDGPNNAASVKAIASWHVNIVRVLLNEDCWLGINGVKASFAGAAYRKAIVKYVQLLHKHHMYAELSLVWGAPADKQATYQSGSPDADHSPAMWASMAATFRNDHNVILAPWGETVTDANCFLHGGVCEAGFAGIGNYKTAGMQEAVTVMRRAGYRGPIAIPGIAFGNDLSHWLSHEPKDPIHQLVAEAHLYGKQVCATVACFDKTVAPVARRVPVLLGEAGESYDSSECGSSFMSMLLNWADAHGVGYEAWTWDAWPVCLVLIHDYSGKPSNEYGSFVKTYYAQHARTTHGPGS